MMMKKVIIIAVAALLIVVTAFGIFSFFNKGVEIQTPEEVIHTLSVASSISSVQELTTLKYEYQDFGTYKREAQTVNIPGLGAAAIPLTKEEFIFTYGGTICVGFDLTDIEPVVDEEQKTITIQIPEAKVLSHTPDHKKDHVYIISQSIMSSTSEKIENLDDSRAELRKQKEEALMSDPKMIQDAVDEYKEMCKTWLINADAEAEHYTLIFVEPETDTSTENNTEE